MKHIHSESRRRICGGGGIAGGSVSSSLQEYHLNIYSVSCMSVERAKDTTILDIKFPDPVL